MVFLKLFLHISGITTIFLLNGILFVNEFAVDALVRSLENSSIQTDVVYSLFLLLGMSFCIWMMMFLTYRFISGRKAGVSQDDLKVFRPATGTVMVETLIVLPVYLLLTFGLAQMTINSMAGLLSTLATFEAGRTLAVWAPEVTNDRGFGSVSKTDATNAARLAAAGVLAPVVPVSNTSMGICSGSLGNKLPSMILGLAGAGNFASTSGDSEGGGFWQFLDGDMSYSARGARKIALAYCATDIDFGAAITNPKSRNRTQITTKLTYRHPLAVPLVGAIFRTPSGIGAPWTTVNVTGIEREYVITQQLSPNTVLPTGGVLQSILQGSLSNPI